MALEVGSVLTRLGFRVDDTGADRYERRLSSVRRESKRDVVTDLKANADSRGFQRYNQELDHTARESRKAESAAKSHGSVLGGLGKTAAFVAGPAALAGVALGLKGAFNAYKESERVGRQTNAVLKSTGGQAGVSAKQVNDLANSISRKTAMDDEAIQSGENLLLTFTNVKNEAGRGNDIFNQTTAVMADMSAALGQDTKSSAIQLGKALNDPIKGVTALQRVGVSFTKSQRDQIKGLVQHGKTLDAQKLILRELNKEFGGSAAATATSSKRLGVTMGNLAETVGKAVSPAFEAVAKGLDSFVTGALAGTGIGGKFVTVAKAIGSAVVGVAKTIGNVVGVFANAAKSGGQHASAWQSAIARLWQAVQKTFSAIVSTVRAAVNGIKRELKGIEPDLIIIGTVIAKLATFVLNIFRKMLPGVKQAWEGIARVIRGVVEVIAGILTLDFSKISKGVGRILSGMVKLAGGIIKELTAPFRGAMQAVGHAVSSGVDAVVGFFARLPGRVVGAVASLPGLLAGLGLRAVSAFGKALSGLPGAIGSALKGGGQFIGDIGRSIADWINAHTPLGDNVKIGPLSVHLPALRRGGKPGNVGPSHGGARAFIAGEGTADEWVISQEGNRSANVRWAREALETLTGKSVELHKGGKGAKKKKGPPAPILGDTTNRGIKRSVGRGEAGIKNFERDIQRMERRYGQADREYGLSDEILTVEHDDGSVTIDEEAVGKRAGELGSLHALRQRIKDKYGEYVKAVGRAIDAYRRAIARLNSAIKAAGGKAREKERGKYVDERAGYQQRIDELKDVAANLGLDLGDQDLDLTELDQEKAAILGTKGSAAPADTSVAGSSGDTGVAPVDTGGGSSGDTGTTTDTGATPAEIATAAIAQVSAFQSARATLFGSYGGNFAAAGGPGAFAGEVGQAAGMRYFGAGGGGGQGGAGAPVVTQIITFPTPPTDPHGWTQASLHELQAAL